MKRSVARFADSADSDEFRLIQETKLILEGASKKTPLEP